MKRKGRPPSAECKARVALEALRGIRSIDGIDACCAAHKESFRADSAKPRLLTLSLGGTEEG